MVHGVFYLLRERTKYELVVHHQRLNLLRLHLKLEWEIIFDGCHLCERQELIDFGSILVVIVSGYEKVARHFVFDFLNFSELVDVKYFILF